MRLAAFVYQQHPQVGLVSDDLQSVTLLDLPVAERVLGALPIVERLCGGAGLPSLLQTVSLKDVRLTAPLPRPRRNIFCVGKNYYAHEIGRAHV